VFTR
ncbi:hypothetical protein D030_4550B, partial [Vibrio parahaemolyticus AQ3810]